MKCPNCQKEIYEEEAVYCPHCGLNLEEELIKEEDEEKEREKKIKIMKKLSQMDIDELLSRGISKDKIDIIREDLRREFLEGNLDTLPSLIKECAFQEYSQRRKEETPKKRILCGLRGREKRCLKEICPLYQLWKKG